MYSKEYNIEFVGMENMSLANALEHLKQQYEFILVECGITSTEQYYTQDDPKNNPIDLLMLSVLQGSIDKSCIG